MEKISKLPPQIAEKIAAGEVVTNPASAVKELVENSMDAGARAITVEIKNGGKSMIRVSDDGAGISSAEVRTAFLRHATSKIKSLEDLDRIDTFGFRGEALTSIAAVSRLELYTKTAEEGAGAMIRIEGGKVLYEKPVGTAEGTTVVVSDLFFNTPARLKFLKSDRAEGARVADVLSALALGRADVRVRLIHNDAILFSTPGRGDMQANILTLYGGAAGGALLPLRAESGDFSLGGCIASAAARRAGRNRRLFFINGRAVRSKLLEKALTEGCAETPFSAGCPFAILFLRVPQEHLDVNIHPAKSEVRFDDENALSAFVTESVRAALRAKEAVPTIPPRERFFLSAGKDGAPLARGEQLALAGTAAGRGPQTSANDESAAYTYAPAERAAAPQGLDIKSLLSSKREEIAARAGLLMEEAEEWEIRGDERTPASVDIAAIEPMGRVFAAYILGKDADCFYFIDQHAAHERVLYERFLRQRREREKLCQQLLAPIVIELPHVARATTQEEGLAMRAFLAALGYEAEDFGANACKINAVPAFLPLSAAEDFLHLLLSELPEGRAPKDEAAEERVISAACKAAVKAGDRLGDAEIAGLLARLAACENPYACPHGRPVLLRLTKRDIERLFKRR
ncbi:MAG: DNA mismatch repair endonuclease MutL [Clostridiales Family XIII bacterium]|nr:DNA mismatch repair endonuclease MutL [Clostridiales Family XIII bacterium]